MKNEWIKTRGKDFWKNEKVGRVVGVQKVRGKYKFYTIKSGYISHADYSNRKSALKVARRWLKE